jgi:thiol-disulfide isomerase/thioredoxin
METLALLALGACALALGLATGALAVARPRRSAAAFVMVAGLAGGFPAGVPVALAASPPVEGVAPGFDGATGWLNTMPLTLDGQRGKVVVVSFWTYSCINCLRTLPYVRAWAQRYARQGLVVVGVHSPEFAFEKDPANVTRAVKDLSLSYPIALDDGYKIWRAYRNRFWPAIYIVDAQGRIRHHQFGEEGAAETEQVIQTLLREAMPAAPAAPAAPVAPVAPGKPQTVTATRSPQAQPQTPMAAASVATDLSGVGMPADLDNLRSPESYLGYAQASAMMSPESLLRDRPKRYSIGKLGLNDWALAGVWSVGPEFAQLGDANGAIGIRFHARDLHLVMAGPPDGARFVLTIDGQPPGEEHGLDVDASGNGRVDASRLYQLVRQRGAVRDQRIEIRFLDPGVRAYAFTFG